MNRIITFVRKKNKTIWEQAIELIFIFLPIIFLIRTFVFGLYQVPTCSMETTLLVGERFFADKLTIWFKKPERGEIISFNDPNFDYSKNPIVKLCQNYLWVPGGSTPQNWTKRVIGIPGDEVKGVVENGKTAVYLKKSGETEFAKLDEWYVNSCPIVQVYRPNFPSSRGTKLNVLSYNPEYSLQDQPYYNMTKAEMDLGAKYARMAGVNAISYPGTPSIYAKGTQYERDLDIFHVKLEDNQYWVMGDNRLGSYDSRAWGPLPGSFIHGRIIYRIFSIDSDEDWLILDILKNPINIWKRIRWTRCLEFVK